MRKFNYKKARLILIALLAPFSFLMAQKQLKGSVTDSAGTRLQGVSVSIKGGSGGTSTDAKGNFSLNITGNPTLVFSSIGYLPKQVNVGNEDFISVKLESLTTAGEAVVVVGYGRQKKSTVSGSVAQVKGADIAKAPVANVTNALVGRLPGLRAVQRSGEPGNDASTIDIRGFGTALTIVDGVPMDFAQLDPAEIESVSILKDASAAVYGIKAANGVVLVTTKRGINGKAKFSYNTYYGWQKPTRYPQFLNAGEFAELTDEALVNEGNAPLYGKDEVEKWKRGTEAGYQGTDWYKLAIKDFTPQLYHNLSVTGGNEATRYFISAGYLNQSGIWTSDATKFKRYNLRTNLSSKIATGLTAEVNLGARLEDKNYPYSSPRTLMNNIQRSFPTMPAFANDNKDYYALPNINDNVLANMDNDYSGYYKEKVRFISAQGSLNYELPWVKGLEAKILYSYTSENTFYKGFNKSHNLYTYNTATQNYDIGFTSPQSFLYEGSALDDNSLLNLSLTYTQRWKKHNLKALALVEQRERVYPGLNKTYNVYASTYLPIDAIQQLDQATQGTIPVGSENREAYRGYIGRINYDYGGKYIVELSGRYDGSWKFPKSDRWGFFPGVSAAWLISRESFFHSNVVNNLKLRASYGVMGDDSDPSFTGSEYMVTYNPSSPYILGPGNILPGLTPGTVPNYNLTWYVAHTSNVGVDLSLFKNMITIEMDVFYRKRTNLFATRSLQIPGTVGASLPRENLNSDDNRGFEIAVGFNKKIGDVSLNLTPNFTWTRARNVHVERAASTNAYENYGYNSENRWKNITWGYKAIGQFQSVDEIAKSPVQDNANNHTLLPGDIKYADINRDGVINTEDQTIIGRGQTPEVYFGLGISASYKNFDLAALLQGASNFSIAFDNEMQAPFFNNANTYQFFADRWHRTDAYDKTSQWIAGRYPSTRFNGTTNNKLPSSFWLTNGQYLRLKTIELGYNFPKKVLSKTNAISIARIYLSGQNLLTFDNLLYVDPEAPNKSADEGNGKYYPQMKVFTVGLNIQF